MESSFHSLWQHKLVLLTAAAFFGTASAVGIMYVLTSQRKPPADRPVIQVPADESIATGSPPRAEVVMNSADEVVAEVAELDVTAPKDDLAPPAVEDDNTPIAMAPTDSSISEPDTPPAPEPVVVDPNAASDTITGDTKSSTETPAGPAASPNQPRDELTEFAHWLQDVATQPSAVPAAPKAPIVDARPPGDDSAVEDEILEGQLADDTFRPTRPAPAVVDVPARLKESIPRARFAAVPLIEVLRTIGDLTTIPISIDTDALARYHVALRQPTTIDLEASGLSDLLKTVLGPLKLDYTVSDGQLIVTTRGVAQSKRIQFAHDVSDLVTPYHDSAWLAGWVIRFVDPHVWKANGGPADCQANGTALVVTHHDVGQYRVLRFLERLRVVRGLKPRTKISPEQVKLTPAFLRANGLAKQVSVRISTKTNLHGLARELESQTEVTILFDWMALHEAGWSPRDDLLYFSDNRSASDTLDDILQPMGLGYILVDPVTIQITSRAAMTTLRRVEFYPPESGIDANRWRSRLDQVARRNAEATIDADIDPVSGCLTVLAAQKIHRELVAVGE
jgi:hypothetical protein